VTNYEHAQSLVAQGELHEAHAEFIKIVEASPEDLRSLTALANISASLLRFDEAEVYFIRVKEKDPKDAEVRAMLGQFYSHLGRLREALGAFREALSINPVYAEAWRGIAHIFVQTGELSKILGAVEEAVKTSQILRDGEKDKIKDLLTEDSLQMRYSRRLGLPLIDKILPLLDDTEGFVILDGGAREAHADHRWQVIDQRRLTIHGFEPDEAECARLNTDSRTTGLNHHYYPIGLWSEEGVLPFETNKTSGGSSFLHQNVGLTNRWKFENPHVATLSKDIFFPLGRADIPVTSLWKWAESNGIKRLDFIKLNIQGGELEVLRGAGPILDEALGLLVEVAFVESYINRPMFSDIDPFLREHGFAFFDLLAHHYVGRSESSVTAQHLSRLAPGLGQLVSSWGQLIEGHALYLRDPIDLVQRAADSEVMSLEKYLKLICIAEVYGQIEYALELLNWLSCRLRNEGPGDLAGRLEQIRNESATEYARFFGGNEHPLSH
jgi:FkbM family methyltransferase